MGTLTEKQMKKLMVALAGLKIEGVPALEVWSSWNPSYKDSWTRTSHFIAFVKWISVEGKSLNPSTLEEYEMALREGGNSEGTISVKKSHIRQILKAAISSGVIPEVALYTKKRGRKPGTGKKRFKKTFLNDLFAITGDSTQDEIKKSYRKLAVKYHPDHGGDTNKFVALKDSYDFLTNTRNFSIYEIFYIEEDRDHPLVNGFVHNIFDRFGGYEGIA